MEKIGVLIVDDSPFIHKVITRALSNEKYEILGIAKNGQEGVQLYNTLKPDVITMDITMPIMDGLDAAREILNTSQSARIIMLSAMGDEELIDTAKSIGIREFLQKPFKPEELLASINNVM